MSVEQCPECGAVADMLPVVLGKTPPKESPAIGYLMFYGRLRRIARAHGYTLAVHGSLNRDLDLVAVPWTEGAVSVEALVEAFVNEGGIYFVPGRSEPTSKPWGLVSYVLFPGGSSYIDLRVMDRAIAARPAPGEPMEPIITVAEAERRVEEMRDQCLLPIITAKHEAERQGFESDAAYLDAIRSRGA